MITEIENSCGCLDVPGFVAEGVHCDIRNKADGRLDLALLKSDLPCEVAGVFTMNRMAAAPVRLCRQILQKKLPARAVIINSGNANACTGTQGWQDAQTMQNSAAASLGCAEDEVFVCSTGRIGEPLPMDRIESGIKEAAGALSSSPDASRRAADAILTSDTHRKVATFEIKGSQGTVRLSGMAKGAGMIEPNMATMLSFICTDASISGEDLQEALMSCVQTSFNAITVDGDESTNDTVLALANGASGVKLGKGKPGWDEFLEALQSICLTLAKHIVGDGEKITKVVELCIEGAKSDEDAALAARAVANSLLVKSSWYGNDPNWGRIMDALGYSGAEMSEDSVSLAYEDVQSGEAVAVFEKGKVFTECKSSWKKIVLNDKFRIRVNLGTGTGSNTVWSTDLTEGYVNFNMSE